MRDVDAAARYRQQAEDLRSLAHDDSVADIRNQLLDLAMVYDRLAREVDDIDDADNRRDG